jgi:hypothetical protein
MELLAIDRWVNELAALPVEEFTTPTVDEIVARTLIRRESLAPCVFCATSYTRNLIYKSDLFEVSAICWDVGQQSLPHDHCGSLCWMVTPTDSGSGRRAFMSTLGPMRAARRTTPRKAGIGPRNSTTTANTGEDFHNR